MIKPDFQLYAVHWGEQGVSPVPHAGQNERRFREADNPEAEALLRLRRISKGLIEKGLEDEGGRYLVNHAAVLLALVTCLIEDLVGVVSCKTFVIHMNRKACKLTQFSRKRPGFGRLRTLFTGEAQRIAYDDG
jgi:hypothetical protein